MRHHKWATDRHREVPCMHHHLNLKSLIKPLSYCVYRYTASPTVDAGDSSRSHREKRARKRARSCSLKYKKGGHFGVLKEMFLYIRCQLHSGGFVKSVVPKFCPKHCFGHTIANGPTLSSLCFATLSDELVATALEHANKAIATLRSNTTQLDFFLAPLPWS
jgi:hypothetical protein